MKESKTKVPSSNCRIHGYTENVIRNSEKYWRCRICQKKSENGEKRKISRRKYAKEHSREINEYMKKSIKELNKDYIKKVLTNKSNLKFSDIPDSLVEAQRLLLLLKRTARRRTNANQQY